MTIEQLIRRDGRIPGGVPPKKRRPRPQKIVGVKWRGCVSVPPGTRFVWFEGTEKRG